MVDIDTHRIIDLFASREVEDVAEWLKSYPNLEVVSRDGSVSYRPGCSSVGQMRESNREEFIGSRDDMIARGYDPCKRCNP